MLDFPRCHATPEAASMERDSNLSHQEKNAKQPQPGTSTSPSANSNQSSINACDDQQHARSLNREQLIKGPNRERSEASAPTTSFGNMDSNPSRESCEACHTPEFLDKYCGVKLCTKCVGFVAKMVKKKFAVKCKQEGKCKITPNQNGKIRCKSCKLESMMKLNINHPAWTSHKKSLSVIRRQFSDSSCSNPSATPRPTPSAPSQPILNDLQPTIRLLSSEQKTPQPGCSASNTGVKVKEATKSEAHKIEKLESAQGGGRAICCRACQRPKDNHDSTLCKSCIQFVIDVRYAGKGFKCNQQGDTSKKEHLMVCPACRFTRITDVTDQTPPAQVDHRRLQPIERQASTSRQSGCHNNQQPKPQSQSASTNVTNNNNSNAGCYNPLVCQGCCNPNHVTRHYGLNLCDNCRKFIKNNSSSPARFRKRCPHNGNCNTRYRPGKKLCASCRTRRLRKLDIQEPSWIKYRMRMGLLRKSDTPVLSTAAKESPISATNPSRTDQKQSKIKRPYSLVTKRCRACSNPHAQASLFGGTLICKACRSFILYTIDTVSDPVICRRGGKCNTRYKPGLTPCRACRIKKLIFSYKIKKGPWMKFKRMYMAKLQESNLYNTKIENKEQQPNIARPPPEASNLNSDRPAASLAPSSEQISEDNSEQSYSWCNDCESQFISVYPASILNYSTEQDSGVCQSPTLQEAPVSVVCPTCQAKRAASLGLRVRHSSSPVKLTSPSKTNSPSKAREHAPRSVSRSPAKDDHGPRKQTPLCPICNHTGRVGWSSATGMITCQNCNHFLQTALKKPKFPPDCITGKHNCELKHIPLAEWNKYNRLCGGCRARKAISLGFKRPPPSSDPMPEQQQQQQRDESNGINQLQQQVSERPGHRELASSVSVISGTASFSTLLCDFCHDHKRAARKKKEGYSLCHSCDSHLQTCETKSFSLLKCKTVAPNCANRGPKVRPKKVCYRCLAIKATSLGHKWTKQLEIVSLLTDPADGEDEQSGQCDICFFKRMGSDSGLGFRWCRKCRKFLANASESRKHVYTCARKQFNCYNEYTQDKHWACPGCRLKRAIDLGYKDSNSEAWLRDNDLLTRPEDAVRSTPSPILVVDASPEAGTTTAEQEPQIADVPSPVGCLFVEDDDEDDRQPSPAIIDDDAIELENLQDYQTTLHPSETMDRVLCRWFSCEQQLPGPSPEPPTKTLEDEIFPTPQMRVIKFSNDIGAGHTMPLVTQDLNPSDERPSVEELTVTKLHMKASSSLRQTLFLNRTDADTATQTTPNTKPAKLKMTLTLKTLRAIVDRSHLLKKQKTSSGAILRPHTSEQPTTRMISSPPLIAPGEDCDASDDENDELPDIDCNY